MSAPAPVVPSHATEERTGEWRLKMGYGEFLAWSDEGTQRNLQNFETDP